MGFNSDTEKILFWQGLQSELKKNISQVKKRRSIENISKGFFIGYDIDGDQTLSKEESWNLLKQLHIPISVLAFGELFKKFDKNGNGKIEFDEFTELMKDRLYKKELEKLFRRHLLDASRNKVDLRKNAEVPMMEFAEVKKFLLKTQQENLTEKQIKEMLDLFFNDKKEERNYKISYLQFCNIIFCMENSIFNPYKETIYQVYI